MTIACPCGSRSQDIKKPEAGRITIVACPACDRRHLVTAGKVYLGVALESCSVRVADPTPGGPA
jgi:hypothetical protein